jgi:hypothetical protein
MPWLLPLRDIGKGSFANYLCGFLFVFLVDIFGFMLARQVLS